ncbi:Uncharacterised protein [Serratia marcescens]|nr:Uncharacterised protein [Serratia marcescens]
MSCNPLINSAVAAILLCGVLPVHALEWPVVVSAETYNVQVIDGYTYYSMRGTAGILALGRPAIPKPTSAQETAWWGIHCQHGSLSEGFSSCSWTHDHGPSYSYNCQYRKPTSESWGLQAECRVPETWNYTGHGGAAPGGECSVFGSRLDRDTVYTPWGALNATAVANSGSPVCVKPAPPTIPCSVGAVGELDHGNHGPNGTGTVFQTATVQCGPRPKIEIIGGGEVDLAAGVSSNVTAAMSNPTTLRIESRISIHSGAPGRYSASKIVVVSPE